MPACKDHHAVPFPGAARPGGECRAPPILVHKHGGHHPALHLALLQRILQGDALITVDNMPMLSAATLSISLACSSHAKEVAASHHDAHFDAQGVHIRDFRSDFRHFCSV